MELVSYVVYLLEISIISIQFKLQFCLSKWRAADKLALNLDKKNLI